VDSHPAVPGLRGQSRHRSFSHRSSWLGPEVTRYIRDPAVHETSRTGKDSYHKLGPRKFAELHNLDIPAIVARLNRKPFIRIETGMFIGYLEDQQYLLGMTEEGLASAVRRMTRLCEEDRRCRALGRVDSPALVNTSAMGR
jgi:hypothetical protein